jgi:hypothetical protein
MISELALPFLLAVQPAAPSPEARFDTFAKTMGAKPTASLQAPMVRLGSLPNPGDAILLTFAERRGRPMLGVKVLCGGEPPRCEPGFFIREDERALTAAEWKEIRDLAGPAMTTLEQSEPTGFLWMAEQVGAGRRRVLVHRTLASPEYRALFCRAYAIAGLTDAPAECSAAPAP